jgi:tRNA A-37 threonylcarbamoyl transferase component Bud32
MLAERADPLIGSTLGKNYRVLERIGTGGMAAVYLVEHHTLLKRFAVKVLSSDLASSLEARARFTQEAHAASQLDHENIVTISDFGVTADQRPFFVMELLRGQTLDQRLGDGPMSIEEVVAVAVPVARALAHAHHEGIVHRDVKPENIFLVQRSQGRWGVKVVDFGIAKTPINPKLTNMNETLGSPLFMAPEMIRGEDDAVDQRTDVYSFGVLLYLMLCGRLPFFDENLLKVMQMHLASPVPPPRSVNPALPLALADVVDRALAKHLDDRYLSMEALLIDLEAALPPGADRLLIEAQSGAAVHETPFAGALAMTLTAPRPVARPTSPPPSAVLPVAPRRSRAPLVLAVGAVAAALIGAGALYRLAGRSPEASDRVDKANDLSALLTRPAETAPRTEPAPVPAETASAAAPAATPAAAAPTAGDSEPPAAPTDADEASAAAPPPAAAVRPGPGRTAPSVKRPPPPRPVIRRGVKPRLPAGAELPAVSPAQVAVAPVSAEPPAAGNGASPAAAEPVRTAEPLPMPAPSPPPPPPPAPPVAGPPQVAAPRSLDAVPEIASFDLQGSLATSVARRSVERVLPGLRACYAAAARAGGAAPAIELRLSFEIDENSLANHVATGDVGFGSLARCAAGVASQIRTTQAPDVGTAHVVAVIKFHPS